MTYKITLDRITIFTSHDIEATFSFYTRALKYVSKKIRLKVGE